MEYIQDNKDMKKWSVSALNSPMVFYGKRELQQSLHFFTIVIDIVIVQANLYEIDALLYQIRQNMTADGSLDCPSFYTNLHKSS